MRAQLTGLLADGGPGRLTVGSEGDSQWADVRLSGRTAVKVRGSTRTDAAFQVSFWAPDMRKYGELRSLPGSTVQAYQYGNFPATPVIEVTGSMPSGYMVASQGRQFVVNQALSSGQTHRIDLARGWLYRGSTLQSGAVDVAESFTVPGGGKPVSVVLTPVSGSGQMTVKVTDTYI
ncbi:hypothetical protein [Microbacterium sp. KR10-403]|uniref:hypothetical protein n=1 Tax=Microbacterium sp. KR10-403 TaxID=3158581 RepID=UPI0032E370F6